MPKIHVEKSVQVEAPVTRVFETLNNFDSWQPWSPWLIQEPEAEVKVSADKKSYEWEGKRIGAGRMKITGEEGNRSISYDLEFLKPWKSKAKVEFETHGENGNTHIKWKMDTGMPWYLFWMTKMMKSFIGMDYQRGLNMLKDYVEDGEVHSKLDFIGRTDFEEFHYVAIKTDTTIDHVGSQMSEDFQKLWKLFEEKEELIGGKAFSIYHKWDMVNGKVSYTSGIPVKSIPENLPSLFTTGKIPSGPVYRLRHTGPYAHLGNAWTTMYSLHRNKVFKLNKKVDPFEIYVNNPGEVPDNDLITEINFAVR
jgi:DNA gyrase inhibitor GyrI